MKKTSRVYVVVPAYNEAGVIRKVLSSVKEAFQNIVVVNDCSQDNTSSISENEDVVTISHAINLGQGAALQTGFDYCAINDADYVITFDADGQHSVADAQAMLNELIDSGCDVALGSRFLGRSVGMPFSRKAILKLAVIYTQITTGLKLTDAHNGLRVLNKKALDVIRIRQNKMAHASEILEQIATKRLKYIEVPVTISYSEYSLSKGQKLWDAFPILIDMIVRKLRS